MGLYQSIIITGGGGMLAHAMIDSLRARGHEPIALPRAQCDITREADLQAIFRHSPTLVLNFAAHTKVDLCEKEPDKANAINGTAVGQLAELCRRNNVCLVHISTDFVFDGKKGRPYCPDDPVNPVCAYGRSKLLGETELMRHAPADWLIVRTAWVYGRHGPNFPRTMVTAARAGKPLRVVADQVGSPTYTVDLAEGILALLDKNARGIWHVTNSRQTTWFDFAKAALQAFGLPPAVEPLTSAQWMQMRPDSAPRPLYSGLDTTGFAKLVGRPMRDWDEALKDFAEEVNRKGWD